jgi:hypothetical protein
MDAHPPQNNKLYSLPLSYKFYIKPYDANFKTQIHLQTHLQTTGDTKICYNYLLTKFADDEVAYYTKLRMDANPNGSRNIISANMAHLHIGDGGPNDSQFTATLEYIQRHGSVKYNIMRFLCAHVSVDMGAGMGAKEYIAGCDGSNSLSASNVRCWRNKLFVKCNRVNFITSDRIDNIHHLCLFILLVLDNNCSAVMQLGTKLNPNDINYLTFLCSKFNKCEMILVLDKIYLYCHKYNRDEHSITLLKKLLGDFMCVEAASTAAIAEIYNKLIYEYNHSTLSLDEFMQKYLSKYPNAMAISSSDY